MDYENFWTLVYDVQDGLKIKEAVRKLHPIQVEEVVTHLACEMNRLKVENEQMKRILSQAILIGRVNLN